MISENLYRNNINLDPPYSDRGRLKLKSPVKNVQAMITKLSAFPKNYLRTSIFKVVVTRRSTAIFFHNLFFPIKKIYSRQRPLMKCVSPPARITSSSR